MNKQRVLKRLRNTPADTDTLTPRDMAFSPNQMGSASEIASFQAPRPLILREDVPLYVAIPAYVNKTTDGSGAQQTFNLSHDLIKSPVTEDLILYSEGNLTQPDSVDYANDSFDYTDAGAVEELDVWYMARDPGTVTVEKVAPGAGTTLAQTVHEDNLAVLHTRDQNQQGVTFGLKRSEFQPYVPRKWDLAVSVDVPYQFRRTDGSGRGAVASNLVLSLPVKRTEQRVQGLAQCVKRDVSNLGGV